MITLSPSIGLVTARYFSILKYRVIVIIDIIVIVVLLSLSPLFTTDVDDTQYSFLRMANMNVYDFMFPVKFIRDPIRTVQVCGQCR